MDILSLWRPILEILILWSFVYLLFRLFQGTRAVQVLMGLTVFVFIFLIAKLLGLQSINWVMEKLLAIGVIAILIIFQPELRRALARLGQNTMLSSLLKEGGPLDEIVDACQMLSEKRIGALIAIQREIGLKNFTESGVPVDAKVSSELLMTIFHPKSPMHDGGVVIIGDRIASCASLFPLTQNASISKMLGTRHRAGIGLTEETDAVTLIVSEETGKIALSVYGKLTKDLDVDGVKRILKSLFKSNSDRFSLFNLWRTFRDGNELVHKKSST